MFVLIRSSVLLYTKSHSASASCETKPKECSNLLSPHIDCRETGKFEPKGGSWNMLLVTICGYKLVCLQAICQKSKVHGHPLLPSIYTSRFWGCQVSAFGPDTQALTAYFFNLFIYLFDFSTYMPSFATGETAPRWFTTSTSPF